MTKLPVNSAYGMVFRGAGQELEWRAFPLPRLEPGELLVEIDYATICGSDLKTFSGKRKEPVPCILGHEMVGRVAEIRGEVLDHYGHSIEAGDRLSWAIYAFDPDSPNARKGVPQKSDNLFKYGHRAIGDQYYLSGGYATHCHLLAGTTLIKIQEDLPDSVVAPLNCAWATVAGGYRLFGDCRGKSVLVYGFGMLGAVASAMARQKGAKWVGVVDLLEARLATAANFGAHETFLAGEQEVPGDIDLVIDLTGVPAVMEEGIGKLAIGGTLLLLGATYPARDLSVNAEYLLRQVLTLHGLHNYTPADLADAYEFMQQTYRDFPFADLVGKEFPLQQLPDAFSYALENPVFRVGVVMR